MSKLCPKSILQGKPNFLVLPVLSRSHDGNRNLSCCHWNPRPLLHDIRALLDVRKHASPCSISEWGILRWKVICWEGGGCPVPAAVCGLHVLHWHVVMHIQILLREGNVHTVLHLEWMCKVLKACLESELVCAVWHPIKRSNSGSLFVV